MDSHDAMDESTTEQYLSIIMNNLWYLNYDCKFILRLLRV